MVSPSYKLLYTPHEHPLTIVTIVICTIKHLEGNLAILGAWYILLICKHANGLCTQAYEDLRTSRFVTKNWGWVFTSPASFSHICWRWFPKLLGDVELGHVPTPLFYSSVETCFASGFFFQLVRSFLVVCFFPSSPKTNPGDLPRDKAGHFLGHAAR